MRKLLLAFCITLVTTLTGHAAVQMKTITYRDGDVTLQGHFAWDDAVSGPRPGVMVVHARHGFTNPDAGKHGIDNLRYDPQADRRSWALMQDFLREALQ